MSSAEILSAEVTRLIGKLPTIDPCNPAYRELITEAHAIIELGERIDRHNAGVYNPHVCTCNDAYRAEKQEPSIEEFSPPVLTVVSEETSEATPEVPQDEEPTATYAPEDVRAKLISSRKRGVNVGAILQEFGGGHFESIPASKYPEVLARIGES